jgi:hypothetical protein
MPDADWKDLYKTALNPDKLAICIQTARQAIASYILDSQFQQF